MTRRKKSGQGFDLKFRPVSYWDEKSLLANVKGAWRRKAIEEAMAEARLEEVPPELFAESLSEEDRQQTGAIHPLLMGGEFLPDSLRGEVEIARVCLQSTTGDVISIRARRQDGWIHYRIVDEYEDEGSSYSISPDRSREPLTLGELIQLIDTSRESREGWIGLTDCFRDFNYEFDTNRKSAESLRYFVTVSSAFYLGLGAYYEEQAEEWLARKLAEFNQGT